MAMAHNKATPLSPYNSSSSSSGSSSSSSSSSSNGNNSSEAESSNPGEYYYVHEILDIRWVKDQNGQEEAQYRVRWFGYDPSNDSWEPKESFDTCQTVLQKFLDLYESLRAKKVAHLQSIGVDPDKADTRHVNILSRHIERIAQKRLKKKNISKSQTLYKVIWKDQDGYYTWETEATLIHAQDKVEEYSRKQRLMRLKVHANMREEGERKEEAGTAAAGEENPDHVRRSQERKFFENLESGELVLKGDLYTRVKSRRARTQSDSIEGSTPEKKQIEKPRSKYVKSLFCIQLSVEG